MKTTTRKDENDDERYTMQRTRMSMKTTILNDLPVVQCFHGGTTSMMKKMKTNYNNNEKRN